MLNRHAPKVHLPNRRAEYRTIIMLSNGNEGTWIEVKLEESMFRLPERISAFARRFSTAETPDVTERIESRTSTIVTEHGTRTTEEVVIFKSSSPALPRDLWTNKIEFLLSVIGYVVDLGNESAKRLLLLLLIISPSFDR